MRITDIFLSATPNSTNITLDGREMSPTERNVEVPLDAVSPDYFRTMGIALRRGRTFTAADNLDAPSVVIVNDALASRVPHP